MTKKKIYDKQFKIDAVQYANEHPELALTEIARTLGIPISNLNRWRSQIKVNSPQNLFRGSGNRANETEKENAKLRKVNKDLKDALDVLKKAISILGD